MDEGASGAEEGVSVADEGASDVDKDDSEMNDGTSDASDHFYRLNEFVDKSNITYTCDILSICVSWANIWKYHYGCKLELVDTCYLTLKPARV